MTDLSEHPIDSPAHPTRRAFLGAGALAVLGLAAPPLAGPAAAQNPKRGGTLVLAADGSPPGLGPQCSSPPPYYNFHDTPTVARGPYDGYDKLKYQKDIRGYVPAE